MNLGAGLAPPKYLIEGIMIREKSTFLTCLWTFQIQLVGQCGKQDAGIDRPFADPIGPFLVMNFPLEIEIPLESEIGYAFKYIVPFL